MVARPKRGNQAASAVPRERASSIPSGGRLCYNAVGAQAEPAPRVRGIETRRIA